MARKSDIEYIRYYTDGSAARKFEPVILPKKVKTVRPKPRAVPVKKIVVDPTAVISIAVAAVLLVMMLVSFSHLNALEAEQQRVEQYIQQLEQENQILEDNYRSGYDLEQIKKTAIALGMVPKDTLQHITIYLDPVVEEVELSLWQRIAAFFTGLIA